MSPSLVLKRLCIWWQTRISQTLLISGRNWEISLSWKIMRGLAWLSFPQSRQLLLLPSRANLFAECSFQYINWNYSTLSIHLFFNLRFDSPPRSNTARKLFWICSISSSNDAISRFRWLEQTESALGRLAGETRRAFKNEASDAGEITGFTKLAWSCTPWLCCIWESVNAGVGETILC